MNQLSAMPSRHPVNITLELTLRCNLRCKMCMFRHSDEENPSLLQGELTRVQWANLALQLRDAGALNLLITGGEPTLRKDFCEIYKDFYQLGFLVTLYTNATLVDDRIMQTLRQYPPHRIGITLYGASNATYKTLCGCSNGFDLALAGAKKLATLPSHLEFRTTIVQDNLSDLDAMEALVKKEFDAPITHASTVFQSVRGGCMSVADCRLTPEQIVNLTLDRVTAHVREALPDTHLEHTRMELLDSFEETASENTRYTLLGCSGGMDSCTITWDGKLLGCQMLDCFQTNAVQLGFEEAWNRWPYIVRLPQVNPDCAQCKHIHLCQVCPGVRMAECGDLHARPTYICKITKQWAARKGENLL